MRFSQARRLMPLPLPLFPIPPSLACCMVPLDVVCACRGAYHIAHIHAYIRGFLCNLSGDLNISNFFWQPPSELNPHGIMSVFDWDQCQKGWFMWDLSAVVFFPYDSVTMRFLFFFACLLFPPHCLCICFLPLLRCVGLPVLC